MLSSPDQASTETILGGRQKRMLHWIRSWFLPRCAHCGKRRPYVPGWCLCQACYEEEQRRPPAIALAS